MGVFVVCSRDLSESNCHAKVHEDDKWSLKEVSITYWVPSKCRDVACRERADDSFITYAWTEPYTSELALGRQSLLRLTPEGLIDVDGAEYSILRPGHPQRLINCLYCMNWATDLCPSIDRNYTGLAGSPVSCVGTLG